MKKPDRNSNRYEKNRMNFLSKFSRISSQGSSDMVKQWIIDNIRENPEKTNIQQILTKKFGQNNYCGVLERPNIFFVMVDGKSISKH